MQKDCLFFSDGNSHTKMKGEKKKQKTSESEMAVTGAWERQKEQFIEMLMEKGLREGLVQPTGINEQF